MGKTYCSDSQGVCSNGWTRNITAGAVHQGGSPRYTVKHKLTSTANTKAYTYPIRSSWSQASQQPDSISGNWCVSKHHITYWPQAIQQPMEPTHRLTIITEAFINKSFSHHAPFTQPPLQRTITPSTSHASCVPTSGLSTEHHITPLRVTQQRTAPMEHINHPNWLQASHQPALTRGFNSHLMNPSLSQWSLASQRPTAQRSASTQATIMSYRWTQAIWQSVHTTPRWYWSHPALTSYGVHKLYSP